MSSKKGKKRRISNSDEENEDPALDRTEVASTSSTSVSPGAATPAAPAAAASANPAAVASAVTPAPPAAGAGAAAAAPAAAAAAAATDDDEKQQVKQMALAKIGVLFGKYAEQKKAFNDFKEKETAELEKLDKERQQVIAKSAEFRVKYEQTDEWLKMINKAIIADDLAQIKRAMDLDPTTLRPSVNRVIFAPASPQRPAQVAAAGESPANSPARFRNAPPDVRAATLDFIKRNGAWFVKEKRAPNPSRPCRACGGNDHWINDAMVKADSPKEHEWVCQKVRLWALAPVRDEPIEVD